MQYIDFTRIKNYFSSNTKYELISSIEQPLGFIKYITLFDIIDGKILDFDLDKKEDKERLLEIVGVA